MVDVDKAGPGDDALDGDVPVARAEELAQVPLLAR